MINFSSQNMCVLPNTRWFMNKSGNRNFVCCISLLTTLRPHIWVFAALLSNLLPFKDFDCTNLSGDFTCVANFVPSHCQSSILIGNPYHQSSRLHKATCSTFKYIFHIYIPFKNFQRSTFSSNIITICLHAKQMNVYNTHPYFW